ncbi:hypothetical protein BU16DRAFT_223626 [Lophium mytilinum]|uniref:Uncharacterized protein n=1 Tax=Lophium mytilinum TaxID=390894 RepID=A0A6A6Q9B7_9PEZI|nr:hypothetical protein BU16DRAFT_223626 [Lophium mytilinum]
MPKGGFFSFSMLASRTKGSRCSFAQVFVYRPGADSPINLFMQSPSQFPYISAESCWTTSSHPKSFPHPIISLSTHIFSMLCSTRPYQSFNSHPSPDLGPQPHLQNPLPTLPANKIVQAFNPLSTTPHPYLPPILPRYLCHPRAIPSDRHLTPSSCTSSSTSSMQLIPLPALSFPSSLHALPKLFAMPALSSPSCLP